MEILNPSFNFLLGKDHPDPKSFKVIGLYQDMALGISSVVPKEVKTHNLINNEDACGVYENDFPGLTLSMIADSHDGYVASHEAILRFPEFLMSRFDFHNEMKNVKEIQLIGINYSENKQNLSGILKSLKINDSKPSVLLYHVPKEFKIIAEQNISLTLSGHTHGGQIFPFNLIERIFSKYISGLYKEKDSYLYVSEGTGTWGPPMRLGTTAEITKIKLIK